MNVDASYKGVGAELFQYINSEKRIIALTSKALRGAQLNYSVIEIEMYAIYYTLKKNYGLIMGRNTLIHSDHKNLSLRLKEPSNRIMRWLSEIQQFTYSIQHIDGKANIAADTLSRLNNTHIKLSYETREILRKYHGASYGHFGVEKTIEIMRKNNIKWDNLEAIVRYYIKNCIICEKMAKGSIPINAATSTITKIEPGEELIADVMYITPSSDGYKYIIGYVDNATKWVELFPIKTLNAEEVAYTMAQVISRFGRPRFFKTDNSSQFSNILVEALTVLQKIEKTYSIPYKHTSNGIIERVFREVKKHLKNIQVGNNGLYEWPYYTPFIMRIINASVHTSTGVSPMYFLYAGMVTPNRGFIDEHESIYNKNKRAIFTVSDKVRIAIQTKQAILKTIRENLTKILEKKEIINESEFKRGDWVFVKYPDGILPNKMVPYWKGPYEVVKVLGSSEIKVRNPNTDDIRYYPTTLARIFMNNNNYTRDEIISTALLDSNRELVTGILEVKLTRPIQDSKFKCEIYGMDKRLDYWLTINEIKNRELIRSECLKLNRTGKLDKLITYLEKMAL